MRRSPFGLLFLLVVLAALLVTLQLAGQASASAGAYKVLIVYADNDSAQNVTAAFNALPALVQAPQFGGLALRARP